MKPFAALRRLRRRTWILIGAAATLVVAAVVVTVVFVVPASTQAEEVTTTSTASLETLEKTVDGTGTVSPLVVEDVDFPAAGTVQTVDVVEGQSVEAGAQLGTIDTLQAEADLLQAKADLADAQAQRSSASGSADIAAADAAVAVAQSSVTDAEAARAGTTLTAPVAGVITSVGVEVGDVVGSTTSVPSDTGDTGTAAAFTITGQDSWEVSVSVSEADVALLEVDDQAEMTTDDGTQLFGVISVIGMLPSTSSGSAQYPVTVQVTGDTTGLYDGISVSTSLIYERRTDVLTVPSAAVTTGDDGTSTVKLVDADGNQVETVVEVGESVGGLTEILSGIVEGDEVVVATFTPGEGNQGTGGFPGGGQIPEGGFTGGEIPEGGFPGGGQIPEGGFTGQNG